MKNGNIVLRDDLSSSLVHLTRGETKEESVKNFRSILKTEKLLGNSNDIRGGFKVVCFSETPISKLSINLAAPEKNGFRYAPFGILFPKDYIYKKGGRPVIYQSNDEYSTLGKAHQYRHVRYEPKKHDYSWEREWRLQIKYLDIDFKVATIIVPTRSWVEHFSNQHGAQIAFMSDIIDCPMPIPIKYHFVALEDLGIKYPEEYREVI